MLSYVQLFLAVHTARRIPCAITSEHLLLAATRILPDVTGGGHMDLIQLWPCESARLQLAMIGEKLAEAQLESQTDLK